jgi:hypothetical protein
MVREVPQRARRDRHSTGSRHDAAGRVRPNILRDPDAQPTGRWPTGREPVGGWSHGTEVHGYWILAHRHSGVLSTPGGARSVSPWSGPRPPVCGWHAPALPLSPGHIRVPWMRCLLAGSAGVEQAPRTGGKCGGNTEKRERKKTSKTVGCGRCSGVPVATSPSIIYARPPARLPGHRDQNVTGPGPGPRLAAARPLGVRPPPLQLTRWSNS